MTDFDFSKNSDDERVLIISFHNELPMSAGRIGTVLRALSSDYWDMTGRELVLARMELGSTWLILTDIVVTAATWIKGGAEVAKATEDLGSFAKKLKNGLKPKPKTIAVNEITTFDTSVDKSIVAMAKVSEETKSTIRMKKTIKTNLGTETLEIEITPAQAKEAKKRVRNKPKPARHENLPQLESRGHDVKHLTQAMRGLPPATGDVETVIRALVQAHIMLGSTYVLEQVATMLEFEGRYDIATIIRQLIGKDKGHVHVEV
ncbi:hypothetical protein [Rhizobium fabae]|uniref:Uncharacterized protein n=1 Tax=Rhizobium fabae TaxID=573179 RepID=A0A7W6BCN0_9HYPH|nr:hypothetical protein [Rhizobium fabae]MBB3919196.1 hypothetical protein [Rhizobium fabae]RUM16487.1 hypothetical protein EFB14_00090 [Rhizobium fabae]